MRIRVDLDLGQELGQLIRLIRKHRPETATTLMDGASVSRQTWYALESDSDQFNIKIATLRRICDTLAPDLLPPVSEVEQHTENFIREYITDALAEYKEQFEREDQEAKEESDRQKRDVEAPYVDWVHNVPAAEKLGVSIYTLKAWRARNFVVEGIHYINPANRSGTRWNIPLVQDWYKHRANIIDHLPAVKAWAAEHNLNVKEQCKLLLDAEQMVKALPAHGLNP